MAGRYVTDPYTTLIPYKVYCRGYKKYKGPAVFEKVGRSRFQLIGEVSAYEKIQAVPKFVKSQIAPIPIVSTPVASDIEEPRLPQRAKLETYRILRDTALAREVKEANKYRCQICGRTLRLQGGKPYAEAHHVKPLGRDHNGPDERGNIMCVCPNDHVLLDYGAIKLDATQLKGVDGEYIDYHNEHIFGKP